METSPAATALLLYLLWYRSAVRLTATILFLAISSSSSFHLPSIHFPSNPPVRLFSLPLTTISSPLTYTGFATSNLSEPNAQPRLPLFYRYITKGKSLNDESLNDEWRILVVLTRSISHRQSSHLFSNTLTISTPPPTSLTRHNSSLLISAISSTLHPISSYAVIDFTLRQHL